MTGSTHVLCNIRETKVCSDYPTDLEVHTKRPAKILVRSWYSVRLGYKFVIPEECHVMHSYEGSVDKIN